MKRLFITLLLALATLFALAACKPEPIDLDGITFEDAEFEYDGKQKTIEATNIPDGITVTYEGGGVSKVGTYTVTAYLAYEDGRDEEIEPLVATLTIKKATYVPEFDGLHVDYNGKKQSVKIKGTLPEGIRVSFENNENIIPGIYTVKATFSYDDECYNEIKPRTLTMKISHGNYSLENLTYSARPDGKYQITGYKGTDTTVVIPERIEGIYVTSIASEAFLNNKTIKHIYMPDTITNIGNSAFRGSTLEEIKLPDTVSVIGTSAFAGCNIKEISLSDNVTSIGFSAFSDTELEYIKIPFIGGSQTSTNDYIGYIFGATEYFRNTAHLPSTLCEVELSAKCVKIPAYAFYGCSSIKTVTIGSSVKSIGNNAFAECTSIESIYIPANVTDIYANVNAYDSPFYKCGSDLKIVFAKADASGFGQYFSHITDTAKASVTYGKTYEQYQMLIANLG